MSTTGRTVMLQAWGITEDPTQVSERSMRFDYRYSPISGGIEGGSLYVPLNGHTETELTQLAQARAVILCSSELQGIDEFELADIYGGKI